MNTYMIMLLFCWELLFNFNVFLYKLGGSPDKHLSGCLGRCGEKKWKILFKLRSHTDIKEEQRCWTGQKIVGQECKAHADWATWGDSNKFWKDQVRIRGHALKYYNTHFLFVVSFNCYQFYHTCSNYVGSAGNILYIQFVLEWHSSYSFHERHLLCCICRTN